MLMARTLTFVRARERSTWLSRGWCGRTHDTTGFGLLRAVDAVAPAVLTQTHQMVDEERIELPFIVIATDKDAEIEVEMNESRCA